MEDGGLGVKSLSQSKPLEKQSRISGSVERPREVTEFAMTCQSATHSMCQAWAFPQVTQLSPFTDGKVKTQKDFLACQGHTTVRGRTGPEPKLSWTHASVEAEIVRTNPTLTPSKQCLCSSVVVKLGKCSKEKHSFPFFCSICVLWVLGGQLNTKGP